MCEACKLLLMFERKSAKVRTLLSADPTIRQGKLFLDFGARPQGQTPGRRVCGNKVARIVAATEAETGLNCSKRSNTSDEIWEGVLAAGRRV